MKQVFAEHGIPERVVSDNGRQYDSATFRNFAKTWGFDHITSSPHYPQSNGFIERTIQTVKYTLTKAKASSLDPDLALLSLRTTPIDHMIPSPAELLNNRKMRGTLPVCIRNYHPQKEDIYEQFQRRQETQKHNFDKHARDLPPLIPGQQVRTQSHISGNWFPAVVIAKCPEPRSYMIQTTNGSTLRRNRNVIRDCPPQETQPPPILQEMPARPSIQDNASPEHRESPEVQ